MSEDDRDRAWYPDNWRQQEQAYIDIVKAQAAARESCPAIVKRPGVQRLVEAVNRVNLLLLEEDGT